jgi:hypothetical protein
MEPEHMSDALDDLAADLAEQPDPFARTRAAYAELLQADDAFDICGPIDVALTMLARDVAVQKVREAIANDTDDCNDRALILSLGEHTTRRLAAQLAGVRA